MMPTRVHSASHSSMLWLVSTTVWPAACNTWVIVALVLQDGYSISEPSSMHPAFGARGPTAAHLEALKVKSGFVAPNRGKCLIAAFTDDLLSGA